MTGDFDLGDPTNLTSPDFAPGTGSILLTGAAAAPSGDTFFDDVDFIGAVDPSSDWVAQGVTDGWIAFEEN